MKKITEEEFQSAMKTYRRLGSKEIPHALGQALLRLCESMVARPSFHGFSWKEDMVSDGVEACVRALPAYDENKMKALPYFTKFAYDGFRSSVANEDV